MASFIGKWEGFWIMVVFIIRFFIEIVSLVIVALIATILLVPTVIDFFELSSSDLPIIPPSSFISFLFPLPSHDTPVAQTSYTKTSKHIPYSKYP
jgi:hypothetical protein